MAHKPTTYKTNPRAVSRSSLDSDRSKVDHPSQANLGLSRGDLSKITASQRPALTPPEPPTALPNDRCRTIANINTPKRGWPKRPARPQIIHVRSPGHRTTRAAVTGTTELPFSQHPIGRLRGCFSWRSLRQLVAGCVPLTQILPVVASCFAPFSRVCPRLRFHFRTSPNHSGTRSEISTTSTNASP